MLKNELTGEEISNDDLESIAKLVAKQLEIERRVAEMSEELQKQQETLKSLSESTIPNAMLALGLSEVKLASGERVTISKYYSASIPGACLHEALAWLRKTGHDDIIKNVVSVQFGKGGDEQAIQIANQLRTQGLVPEQKTFVHPMTLKSFVKERIESGEELPQELFGVFIGNKTKITQVKK